MYQSQTLLNSNSFLSPFNYNERHNKTYILFFKYINFLCICVCYEFYEFYRFYKLFSINGVCILHAQVSLWKDASADDIQQIFYLGLLIENEKSKILKLKL